MKTHYSDDKQGSEYLTMSAKTKAVFQPSEPQVNSTILLGKLFYAVIIIGFMGYYIDKIMQPAKG